MSYTLSILKYLIRNGVTIVDTLVQTTDLDELDTCLLVVGMKKVKLVKTRDTDNDTLVSITLEGRDWVRSHSDTEDYPMMILEYLTKNGGTGIDMLRKVTDLNSSDLCVVLTCMREAKLIEGDNEMIQLTLEK